MKILLTGMIVCALVVTAFADVNINATGRDWVEFSDGDKKALVSAIYDSFSLDPARYPVLKGVEALDDYYYAVVDEAEGSLEGVDADFTLKQKCADILRSMVKKNAGALEVNDGISLESSGGGNRDRDSADEAYETPVKEYNDSDYYTEREDTPSGDRNDEYDTTAADYVDNRTESMNAVGD
ncbi:MAG: hypothetical protein ABH885_01850 [Candidatus Omnitrophota bacterium]